MPYTPIRSYRQGGGVVTQTVVVEVPIDNSEVVNETLRYDLPEIHTVPTDMVSAVVDVQETSPTPEELGILAVLLLADETHPVPIEDVTGTEAIVVVDETHVAPESDVTVVADVQESSPAANDEITAFVLVLDEQQPVPVEDVTGTEADFTVDETYPVPTHTTEIDSEVLFEEQAAAEDDLTVEVDVSYLWPNATVTTTGWANTALMIDKLTGTNASCTATSSGIAGTGGTENSTASNFAVSVLDPQLDDLTIDDVEMSWLISATTTGVQLTAGRCEINYQYSTDNGSNWTTFFAQTAQNSSNTTLDITGVIGGDWQKIKDMRFRANGTVFSGTGLLPVSTVAQWSYCRLRILASQDY